MIRHNEGVVTQLALRTVGPDDPAKKPEWRGTHWIWNECNEGTDESRKFVELNPENMNAEKMLAKLKPKG